MRATIAICLLGYLLVFDGCGALAAPIGLVQRTSGEAWLYSRTERAKPVHAGQAFESGVSIATGPSSSVVLRFQDGQVIVLASNSTFRVKEFEFSSAAPASGHLLFELVKGGMRSISGGIGESNREGWRLDTPAAMIGISGTDFYAVVERGLYAHVNAGSVTLANDAGTISIGAAGTAFVGGEGIAPIATSAVPQGIFGEVQTIAIAPASGGASVGSGAAGASTSISVTSAVAITAAVIAGAVAAGSGGNDATTTHH